MIVSREPRYINTLSEQKNVKIVLVETTLVKSSLSKTEMNKHSDIFVLRDLCSIEKSSSILLVDSFTRADFSEQKNLKIAIVETTVREVVLVGDPLNITRSCICFTGLVLNREVFVNTFDG